MPLAVLVNNKTKASHLHLKKRNASAVSFNSLIVLIFRTAEWRNGSLAGTGQWDKRAGFDPRLRKRELSPPILRVPRG